MNKPQSRTRLGYPVYPSQVPTQPHPGYTPTPTPCSCVLSPSVPWTRSNKAVGLISVAQLT